MHKIYNSISLAYKAKKLMLGTEDVVKCMKSRKKMVVLMDSSASINTFKVIQNKSEYYGAKLIVLNDINKNLEKIFKNKQIKVMAIRDTGFRNLIYKNIKE